MKPVSRSRIAMLLTVIYVLISVSSLASCAGHMDAVFGAAGVECSGDCGICGCPPAQSARHACCCWKKRQLQNQRRDHGPAASCCKSKQHGSGSQVLSCGTPCGSRHQPALWDSDDSDHMPYYAAGHDTVDSDKSVFGLHPDRVTDRHGDPPDPPPKVSLSC